MKNTLGLVLYLLSVLFVGCAGAIDDPDSRVVSAKRDHGHSTEVVVDTRTEKDLLQGKWEVIAAERSGESNDKTLGTVFVFDGDSLRIENEVWGVIHATFAIHSKSEPKELTWWGVFNGQDFVVRAIYQRDGDNLTYCAQQQLDISAPELPRPTEFHTTPEDNRMLCKLRRVLRSNE